MAKNLLGSAAGKMKQIFAAGKKCARCGSDKGVTKVYVSNFAGQGYFENLCTSCAFKEKMKCY